MDFVNIVKSEAKDPKDKTITYHPDFIIKRTRDLMIRGGKFYAIWDEAANLWSTDEYDVQRLVDDELRAAAKKHIDELGDTPKIKLMEYHSTNAWKNFRNYMSVISDNSHQLDENLTFSNTHVTKTDYVSKRLPYALEDGDYSAWDDLVGVLYNEDERRKIEWAIGAVVAGDAKTIQKFLVFYGSAGTGKSTILNIIEQMFTGYVASFEAKALTNGNNGFSMETFKSNPLVAIQHDGDLSKIEDNTKLNSIISHEKMTMNEKFKAAYDFVVMAFLFMGTNKPVKITDSKSGIIRRLIDVHPTGEKIPAKHYQALMAQISFQLGAIAKHCLDVYLSLGKNYYDNYKPVEMMLQTDVFYNYIETYYDVFKEQNGTTLTQAYNLYKEWTAETLVEYKLAQYKFREELRNYFEKFEERAEVDGVRVRSWYSGFKTERFTLQAPEEAPYSLVMDETTSIFDDWAKDFPAQYSRENGHPYKYWSDDPKIRQGEIYIPKNSEVVSTTLKDIDTTKEHFVKVPMSHIVIDFDLADENGEKSAELNLAAASQWPATYSEFSKSGAGIHLHYNYPGDVERLSRIFADGIEIKVFVGDSSLRRRFSKTNNLPIATLTSGLPLKEKKVITSEQIKSEKSLREQVMRNLRKEIHPGTKPSMDFIHKILEDAYKTDLSYDLNDMKGKVMAFANNSSHQSLYCLKLMQTMHFESKDHEEGQSFEEPTKPGAAAPKKDERLVIYDVEVFPNLFVICWTYEGSPDVVTMINPKPHEVQELITLMRLVGFNNRRYDNHIMYAASLGYNNQQLFELSQKLIKNTPNSYFGAAYEISYADIYDFSSIKQGLKKFEIDLNLPHKELDMHWVPADVPSDERWSYPVPPEFWREVAEYCAIDVVSTDGVLQDRKADLVARQILAELSGLSVMATTQAHTAKIIFEGKRQAEAQSQFVYTDLSKEFPGYTFALGKSDYRGENPSEGGYVYAEPGIYENVALLDIQSMHPTTIEQLKLFGPFTKNYSDIKNARVAIKHGDYEAARKMLDGRLAPYLKDETMADQLAYALKIVVNIVYGLTSASFDNPFRDKRNIDNIVAKRGALFMIELKHFVQEQGYTVVHIKTDSIKIANADRHIIELVMQFGKDYGYIFEHEETYDKICLVNNAVYIAKTKDGKKPSHWTATGAQFAHPYVFKTLFSHEPIVFRDKCEAKMVTTALYLEEKSPDNLQLEFTDQNEAMALVEPVRKFIGKAGLFCPIQPGRGGGVLVREKDGKYSAATGTTGFEWLEAEMVLTLNLEDEIDMKYFRKLIDAAMANISKYGDAEAFIS